ncbi:hypothetical protein FisN_7Hh381 [Fistulifera solaris]|uniref:Uncharacterized protein n=1 Tax=Fistulifera solaris TaxID=1519565 RepID=A0A1Z5KS65_FISSO|nr:hypothetical protein FisN_7Hh381 [Fistulifera solaris]|eukprot:GAX29027.1 hypothetical protein FisN_7Hh381 [Fistulifera solaris]
MHPSERRSSSSPKRRSQRQQQRQQQDSSTSTDSTVSSCISYSEDGTGSLHSSPRKCVHFSTVSTHWIQCDKAATIESVDHHEIRKSAVALERIIGALKIEEYQRMASSTRKPKVKAETKETQQPRKIRVATRPPPEHSNRRRILVRASSLSTLPTEKRTRSPSPLRRAVSPLRRAASPLRRFRNTDEKENTHTTSNHSRSNKGSSNATHRTSNSSNGDNCNNKSRSNGDSRKSKNPNHSSSIDNSDKDARPGRRFLRADSFSRLGRSMVSPRKKRVDP